MKRSAFILSLLLAGCLLFSGCLFGGAQSGPEDPAGTIPPETSPAETAGTQAPDAEASTEAALFSTKAAEPAETPETQPSAAEAETTAPFQPGPGTAEAPSQDGPGRAEDPSKPPQGGPATAEANSQIMTATETAAASEAYQILSKMNWADTVWADSGDRCHLRITELSENGLSFYWHNRVEGYPSCIQSQLCSATFDGDFVSCDYTDERGNAGVVRLTVHEQAISWNLNTIHNARYGPAALDLTLLPRTSGTPAFYFDGAKWQDNLVARNQLYSGTGGSPLQAVVNDYMENTLEITDVSGQMVYLLESGTRFYTEAELSGFSKDLIRLFKNEIYARHGYRFETKDLYNIFLHFTWYYPDFSPANFKESVFNQYEKENLKLLVKLEGK